ncbi:hypothetical protein GFL18_07070 [Rhizobium leguminosarum bv. viciae]|nr:hypothetical protein [Rhizobium leguminosarum bv. viciae]
MAERQSGIVGEAPSSPQRGEGARRADEGGGSAYGAAPRLRSVRSLLPLLAPLIASLCSALLPAGEKRAQAADVLFPIGRAAEEDASHPIAAW